MLSRNALKLAIRDGSRRAAFASRAIAASRSGIWASDGFARRQVERAKGESPGRAA